MPVTRRQRRRSLRVCTCYDLGAHDNATAPRSPVQLDIPPVVVFAPVALPEPLPTHTVLYLCILASITFGVFVLLQLPMFTPIPELLKHHVMPIVGTIPAILAGKWCAEHMLHLKKHPQHALCLVVCLA